MTEFIDRDVDWLIINCLKLPDLVNLVTVNKYFSSLVSEIPVIYQLQCINKLGISAYPTRIIGKVFKFGFSDYAKYLKKYVQQYHLYCFRICCKYGRFDMAKWIIDMYEGNGSVFNIIYNNNIFFTECCKNGYLDMAKWLVQLRLSDQYYSIVIHGHMNTVFYKTCRYGQYEVAKWLVELGETVGYQKVKIDSTDGSAFINCCTGGHINIAKWLIELGESDNYDKVCLLQIKSGIISCCRYGHFKMLKWLLELYLAADNIITAIDELYAELLLLSVRKNHKKIVNWMICKYGPGSFDYTKIFVKCIQDDNFATIMLWYQQLTPENRKTIDIHADNDVVFKLCCRNGNIEMAKWIVQLSKSNGYVKFDMTDRYFARKCRKYGHYRMAKWLDKIANRC